MAIQKELLFQSLLPAEATALVAVMTSIVPHADPELREVVLYTALAYDAQIAKNTELRNELREQLWSLDKQAVAKGAASFAAAEPDLQRQLLEAIEDTDFFQRLVYGVVCDFYNRHIVWEKLGYPGLAQRDGQGYINSGYDVLDWQESKA